MNAPDHFSPRAAEHARLFDQATDIEKRQAQAWATMPREVRADVLQAVGLNSNPDVPFLQIEPATRQAIRDHAWGVVGYSTHVGGLL